MEEIYRIKFPKIQVGFNKNQLVFLINNVKSRHTSALYFKFYCYDGSNTLFYTYISPRWVIDTEYRQRVRAFDLSDEVFSKVLYVQIELFAVGNSSENPLYFNQCMLCEYAGENYDYHDPHEVLKDASVGLINSRYANLYTQEGNYLQVIRPEGTGFSITKLDKDVCTVLAPHLADEEDIDDAVNVFMEFINQTEQRIDVLR